MDNVNLIESCIASCGWRGRIATSTWEKEKYISRVQYKKGIYIRRVNKTMFILFGIYFYVYFTTIFKIYDFYVYIYYNMYTYNKCLAMN